jgi:hypothetical protein
MIVFSFWPDVIMIKEIGDPMTVARFLDMDRNELHSGLSWPRGGRTPTTPSTCMPAIPFSFRDTAP